MKMKVHVQHGHMKCVSLKAQDKKAITIIKGAKSSCLGKESKKKYTETKNIIVLIKSWIFLALVEVTTLQWFRRHNGKSKRSLLNQTKQWDSKGAVKKKLKATEIQVRIVFVRSIRDRGIVVACQKRENIKNLEVVTKVKFGD